MRKVIGVKYLNDVVAADMSFQLSAMTKQVNGWSILTSLNHGEVLLRCYPSGYVNFGVCIKSYRTYKETESGVVLYDGNNNPIIEIKLEGNEIDENTDTDDISLSLYGSVYNAIKELQPKIYEYFNNQSSH